MRMVVVVRSMFLPLMGKMTPKMKPMFVVCPGHLKDPLVSFALSHLSLPLLPYTSVPTANSSGSTSITPTTRLRSDGSFPSLSSLPPKIWGSSWVPSPGRYMGQLSSRLHVCVIEIKNLMSCQRDDLSCYYWHWTSRTPRKSVFPERLSHALS